MEFVDEVGALEVLQDVRHAADHQQGGVLVQKVVGFGEASGQALHDLRETRNVRSRSIISFLRRGS